MLIRRRTLPFLLAGLLAVLVSCGGSEAGGWDAQGVARSNEGTPYYPILANSPFGLGPNRVSIALTSEGALLSGATVTVRFYRLAERPEDEPSVAELTAEQVATARTIGAEGDHVHADGSVHVHSGVESTVYVANVEFDTVGWWGMEVDAEIDGERHEGMRSEFWVEASSEPAIGAAVPRSEQLTLRDVADVSEIDSSVPPNPALHELTIAEALDTGKPVVVAFVTPAFCQTRFCGPVMDEVILPVQAEYAEVAEFIHVEPFDLQQAREGSLVPVPTVEEWGLLAEPFVFVLNPDGTVAAKFEGIMEAEEIASALDAVLGR